MPAPTRGLRFPKFRVGSKNASSSSSSESYSSSPLQLAKSCPILISFSCVYGTIITACNPVIAIAIFGVRHDASVRSLRICIEMCSIFVRCRSSRSSGLQRVEFLRGELGFSCVASSCRRRLPCACSGAQAGRWSA